VSTALQLLAAIVRSSLTATLAAAAAEAPTMGPTGGRWRRRSWRSRPREQPRLRSLTGRLRRSLEDRGATAQEGFYVRRQRRLPRLLCVTS
jgi:hypothetical protein